MLPINLQRFLRLFGQLRLPPAHQKIVGIAPNAKLFLHIRTNPGTLCVKDPAQTCLFSIILNSHLPKISILWLPSVDGIEVATSVTRSCSLS